LKSKVLIVAEAPRIAKQMHTARTPAFSYVLKGMEDPSAKLEEPIESGVCYTEIAFKANYTRESCANFHR
jgi:hypothetical protein